MTNIIDCSLELTKTLELAESNINSTNLITMYLPPNNNLWLTRDHICREVKTANNIKNKILKKSIIEALVSVNYQLKLLTNIPEYGMIIYAGDFRLPNNVEYLSCL